MLRGKDFTFTVTGTEEVTPEYRRVRFTDGGLLAQSGVHPTMWVRVWFERDGKPHQRAYTLVDPDPEQGTFSLEFALHQGTASDWARTAAPGDTIDATVQGTGFTAPDPAPAHLYAVADPASLPALNSLLDTFPATPATIWFETPDEAGPATKGLPFRTDPTRHTGPHSPPRTRRRPPHRDGEIRPPRLPRRRLPLDSHRHPHHPHPGGLGPQGTGRVQGTGERAGVLAAVTRRPCALRRPGRSW